MNLSGRYLVILGPNTNQWWVYDDENDVYIDPPTVVLDTLAKHPFDEQEAVFEGIVADEPDWLNDKDHWYKELEP